MAKVRFSRGLSTDFEDIVPESDVIYFLTDTQEIYLGDKKYGSSSDSSHPKAYMYNSTSPNDENSLFEVIHAAIEESTSSLGPFAQGPFMPGDIFIYAEPQNNYSLILYVKDVALYADTTSEHLGKIENINVYGDLIAQDLTNYDPDYQPTRYVLSYHNVDFKIYTKFEEDEIKFSLDYIEPTINKFSSVFMSTNDTSTSSYNLVEYADASDFCDIYFGDLNNYTNGALGDGFFEHFLDLITGVEYNYGQYMPCYTVDASNFAYTPDFKLFYIKNIKDFRITFTDPSNTNSYRTIRETEFTKYDHLSSTQIITKIIFEEFDANNNINEFLCDIEVNGYGSEFKIYPVKRLVDGSNFALPRREGFYDYNDVYNTSFEFDTGYFSNLLQHNFNLNSFGSYGQTALAPHAFPGDLIYYKDMYGNDDIVNTHLIRVKKLAPYLGNGGGNA